LHQAFASARRHRLRLPGLRYARRVAHVSSVCDILRRGQQARLCTGPTHDTNRGSRLAAALGRSAPLHHHGTPPGCPRAPAASMNLGPPTYDLLAVAVPDSREGGEPCSLAPGMPAARSTRHRHLCPASTMRPREDVRGRQAHPTDLGSTCVEPRVGGGWRLAQTEETACACKQRSSRHRRGRRRPRPALSQLKAETCGIELRLRDDKISAPAGPLRAHGGRSIRVHEQCESDQPSIVGNVSRIHQSPADLRDRTTKRSCPSISLSLRARLVAPLK